MQIRKVFFWLHLAAGCIAGAIVLLMSVTGAMLTYERHLTSVTGGRGSYHMEFSHYDEVPSHQQQKIIAASKAERGQAVEEQA